MKEKSGHCESMKTENRRDKERGLHESRQLQKGKMYIFKSPNLLFQTKMQRAEENTMHSFFQSAFTRFGFSYSSHPDARKKLSPKKENLSHTIGKIIEEEEEGKTA